MRGGRGGAKAAAHSAMTSGSVSVARRFPAQRSSRARSSRPSAHTAAPRTSGAASSSKRSASAASAASPGIADRDQHIAHEACAADALDRAFAEQRAEAGVVELHQFGKARRLQYGTRRKLRFAPGLREFVPRANRQAIVAAVDAIADQRAQRARDRALVLDGQIGDAAPRIEAIRRGKCRRRADVEAGAGRCRNGRAPGRRAAGRAW